MRVQTLTKKAPPRVGLEVAAVRFSLALVVAGQVRPSDARRLMSGDSLTSCPLPCDLWLHSPLPGARPLQPQP
jgi:hypothetical protein